eukprot:3493643-Heterocapsa_arctica.AAC.1
MDGFVCPGRAPRRGIIAGCSAATTLVKVYTIMECDQVVQMHPEVGSTSLWTTGKGLLWEDTTG